MRDPAIAHSFEPGTFLYVAGSGGWGFDLGAWMAGFVREADPLPKDRRRSEAERFLDFLRLRGGTVPMQVRTTIAGVELDEDVVVRFPFGRLRRALPNDFSAPHVTRLPPATVFEYDAELPARFGTNSAGAFVHEADTAVVQRVEEQHDETVARVLLALLLAHEGPAQEHLTMRAPRYLGGGTGMNPLPLAPIVVSHPYYLGEGPRVTELVEIAGLIADIPIGRLGVVARRYLMAVTERTRPVDQIIDCSIAFEALTGTSRGREQGNALAALIGAVPGFGSVDAEHRLVKDARDVILHEGKTPAKVDMLASKARSLVRLALRAAVREAISDDQS